MFDQVFWVGVSFITFLALMYKPVTRGLVQALDKRAAQIAKDLDDAARLREEAQAALASYQQKHAEITKEAETILAKAKQDADAMRDEAAKKLAYAVEVRTKRAHDRIAQEEAKAMQAIQSQVVDAALGAAQQILTGEMKAQAQTHLIDAAVAKVPSLVH
jgi:F-type H+-transporting ATPase subunit b